jgi:MFS family permease
MLEPSLPLWMMESWSAGSIERGAAFLPASISYLIGTNIFGPLAHKIGRWLSGFIGLVVIGFCLLAVSLSLMQIVDNARQKSWQFVSMWKTKRARKSQIISQPTSNFFFERIFGKVKTQKI